MTKWIQPIILMIFLVVFFSESKAQRRRIELSQSDSRFTIGAESYYNFVHDENLYYHIQNNTNEKYELVVEVTVRSSCFEERNYLLGYNRVVVLLPGGRFTDKNDHSHIYIGSEATKNCRIKVGDTYTYVSGISYRYSSIRNITKEESDKKQKELELQISWPKRKN